MVEDLIYEWTDPVFALIFGGVCPAVLLYVGVGMVREARASRHWPRTTGTIIASHIAARQQSPYDAELANRALLEYQYQVNGQSYLNSQINLADKPDAVEWTTLRERYPVGQKVSVYYDPANPQQAVLEHDTSNRLIWSIALLFVIALGMPVFALLLVFNVMTAGSMFMVVFCSVIPFGLSVALFAKYREIHAARRWLQTTGTVVTSRVEARKKRPGDFDYDGGDTEVTNTPLVVYEYHVNGQAYRSSRFTIGERTSEYELESILDRHPVGTQVDVYYDPANPHQAVLERDVPASVYWIGGGCWLFSIAVPIVAIVLYNIGLTWFNGGAIVLAGMGLATFGFAIAYTAMSVQASRWPTVPGRIVAAKVDAYRARPRKLRTYFKPSVQFTYEVNGRQYHGDRVRIAVVVSSTLASLAGWTASAYPVGSEVLVYYNPKKPSESVLHPWSWWILLPWLIVVVFLFGLPSFLPV